jgi:putative PEP-CTERM system histidine kinase
MSIGTISYSLGAVAFLLLLLVLLTGWRGRLQGGLLLAAAATSMVWAALLAVRAHYGLIGLVFQWAETARFLAWFAFLLGILKHIERGNTVSPMVRLTGRTLYGLSAILIAAPLLPQLVGSLGSVGLTLPKLLFGGYLVLAVGGLWLVELLFRNTQPGQRWAIKFLCLGLGGMFAYDFFLYAHALLFQSINQELWNARGAINGLVVPLIAVSAARNPDWSLDVFVSRHVVFHSASLFAAGVYLMLMAAAGYYIKVFGGEWGAVAQAVFLFGAVVILIVMLFSGQVRARLRVLVSKHFYNYKYDYREEWLRFTHSLSQCKSDSRAHECVVGAIAGLVDSPGGMLWRHGRDGGWTFQGRWNMPAVDAPMTEGIESLQQFMERTNWVVNLEEYETNPEIYEGLHLPGWLLEVDNGWVLVPLQDQEALRGFVLLATPRAAVPADWEVRDLLKTAATQAASHLAQMEAMQALAEARQFEGFHRLAAFILHDIKNLIAQQSVVVNSAARHKHNPAFVDDAIGIMEHSVAKMHRLMRLFRTGMAGGRPVDLDLCELIEQVVTKLSAVKPAPQFSGPDESLMVSADRDRLASAIENVVRNGQEATGKDGNVRVELRRDQDQALVLIEDDGSGMDEQFVRDRLFRPFDTTKGDTGMGIGAYDSREYLRALGGDLMVASQQGKGSVFTLRIPLVHSAATPLAGAERETREVAG